MTDDFDQRYSELVLNFTQRVVGGSFVIARSAELARTIEQCEAAIDAVGLAEFANERFSVSQFSGAPEAERGDIIFPKINHGFWEQLYALFRKEIDPARMRVTEKEPHSSRYLASGLLDGLHFLTEYLADRSDRSVCFQSVKFGFSLGNGDTDHVTLLEQFSASRPRVKKVNTGAAIGAAAFFESMFGERKVYLTDGCFGKKGLQDGFLDSFISDRLRSVDRIVFVVPPHLSGIKLRTSDIESVELLVSGQYVHEQWRETVIETAHQILGLLDRGMNVLVFCQAGVVSGLLGLFLAYARDILGRAGGSLDYLDLGQVLDVANPEEGGPWVRLHGHKGSALFGLAG